MAQRLMQQWRLAVLRVALDVSEREPAVVVDMLSFPDGTESVVWSERVPPDDFGLGGPVPSLGEVALLVPGWLRQRVRATLKSEFAGEAALWLHLVRPHGYLGAIPWEQVLVPETGVPLFRVPDRLPVAPDPGRAWRVAVVLNAAPNAHWTGSYVRAFAGKLAAFVDVPLEIHVFADIGSAKAVTGALEGSGLPVVTHYPGVARAAAEAWLAGSRRTRVLGAAELWSGWVAAEMRSVAASALHVVTDAVLDGDEGLLAVSPDPGKFADATETAYLTGDDVLRLADCIGAATLSFGSPPDNPSDVATRIVADAAGVDRPGTTAYVSLAADEATGSLAALHAFLANPPGETDLPVHPALFGYVQPERVQVAFTERWPDEAAYPLGGTSPGDDVQEIYANTESVPTWVAASERYIASQAANLLGIARPGRTARGAYDEGAREGLKALRAMLDRHVRDLS